MKIISSILLLLAILLLGFAYLPLPGLVDQRMSAEEQHQTTIKVQEHFAKIENGQNLDRPFPVMLERADNPSSKEKIELGRLLFFDPILSADKKTSCASCHHPDLGFADNRKTAMGLGGTGVGKDRKGGAVLPRNTPSIWNSGFNFLQFWDGAAKDLEEQAKKPINAHDEMGQDSSQVVIELLAIPQYVDLFEASFRNEKSRSISFQNTVNAIAAFERTLVSDDSRFDRYAKGDDKALSLEERRGLNLFRSLKTRCFECHNIPTFNNPDFKIIGVPAAEGKPQDLGRGVIAGDDYNHAFKVPTLRNVALTAPYMHNGVFSTLTEVIDFYKEGGGIEHGFEASLLDDKIRPFDLTETERSDLINFLHALTDQSKKGEIPKEVPSGLSVVASMSTDSSRAGLSPLFPSPRPPEPRLYLGRQGSRIIVREGDSIQLAIDQAQKGDTVAVYPGVYHETLSIDRSEITILGMGTSFEDVVLDGQGSLNDGIIGSGRNIEIRNLSVVNYTANGIMIDLGVDLVFRDLLIKDTGLYGLYPVESVGIEIDNVEVWGVRDAGIYVGQSKDIVVRNSSAFANVTGIEIENSLNALVENNHVEDNTGGILVFGLPNNPSKISENCRVFGNTVLNNNRPNFGDPSAVVSKVPAGSGIIVMAGDKVEIADNIISGNDSFGIAISSLGTFLEGDGGYDIDPYSDEVEIYGNHFSNNGTQVAQSLSDIGLEGADLIWDLTGRDNSWNQEGASSFPPGFPSSNSLGFADRLSRRFFRLLSK